MQYNRAVQWFQMLQKIVWVGGKAGWVANRDKKAFWAAHQRFFSHMMVAAKVRHTYSCSCATMKHGSFSYPPHIQVSHVAIMARKAVEEQGMSVVIGLQSTGEAHIKQALKADSPLAELVSAPMVVLRNAIQLLVPRSAPASQRSSLKTLHKQVKETLAVWKQTSAGGAAGAGSDAGTGADVGSDAGASAGAASAAHGGMVVAIEEHCEMPRSGSLITWAALVDAVSTAAAKPSSTSCLDQPDNSDAEDDTEPEESSDSDVNDADDAKTWDDEATQTLNAIRTGLLEAMEQQLTLPPNPLDDLIGQLGGPAAVAEMTGRSGQQRRTVGGTVVYADRDASNIQEQVMFQDGVKRYAIVSKVPVSLCHRTDGNRGR